MARPVRDPLHRNTASRSPQEIFEYLLGAFTFVCMFPIFTKSRKYARDERLPNQVDVQKTQGNHTYCYHQSKHKRHIWKNCNCNRDGKRKYCQRINQIAKHLSTNRISAVKPVTRNSYDDEPDK